MLFFRWVKAGVRRGLPPHRRDLLNTVQRFIKDTPGRTSPFKDDMPGKVWFNVSLSTTFKFMICFKMKDEFKI